MNKANVFNVLFYRLFPVGLKELCCTKPHSHSTAHAPAPAPAAVKERLVLKWL